MEARLLGTIQAEYSPNEWDGHNRSGIQPLCDKVLVKCDQAVQQTKGGIILTGTTQESQTLASTTGIMVAVGPQAFAYDSDRTVRWEGDRPVAGARIYFQKYAGQEYTGRDGELYRLMQDRSVAGVEITE